MAMRGTCLPGVVPNDPRGCSGPFCAHAASPQTPSATSPHPMPPSSKTLPPRLHVAEPDRAPGQTASPAPAAYLPSESGASAPPMKSLVSAAVVGLGGVGGGEESRGGEGAGSRRPAVCRHSVRDAYLHSAGPGGSPGEPECRLNDLQSTWSVKVTTLLHATTSSSRLLSIAVQVFLVTVLLVAQLTEPSSPAALAATYA